MQRFDGAIAGLGTASGVRVVLGMWRATPFGPIADAMIERPDGHRILIAPSRPVADFIAGTYRFDEVRVEPVSLHVAGRVRTFGSPSLVARIETGPRTALGRLLALVPARLARRRWWASAVGPAARLLRRIRTTGTAGNGRREWYCALDEHRLTAARATLDGAPLGALRPVQPPVRFGFASTPAGPSLVAVTTWVAPGADGAATASSPR